MVSILPSHSSRVASIVKGFGGPSTFFPSTTRRVGDKRFSDRTSTQIPMDLGVLPKHQEGSHGGSDSQYSQNDVFVA